MDIVIYFDYLCPYAYRGVRFFTEMAESSLQTATIEWRHFSLEQINALEMGRSEEWKIWEQPLDYEPLWGKQHLRGLTAFLASHAASLQGEAAFKRFRLTLYRYRHETRKDSSNPEVIMEAAREAELDMARFSTDWQSPAARERLKNDHLSGVAQDVFGVPTVIIDDCEPTYIRLSEYPPETKRKSLLNEIIHTLTQRPYLQELKRVSALED